jgi:hypothetical protein
MQKKSAACFVCEAINNKSLTADHTSTNILYPRKSNIAYGSEAKMGSDRAPNRLLRPPFSVRNIGNFFKFGHHLVHKKIFDDQYGAQYFPIFQNKMEDATDR